MNRILIKNGRLIDPDTGRDGLFDLLLEDGKVSRVCERQETKGQECCESEVKVLDAAGCFVMPGFIDLHVHFRDPGFEYKETLETGAYAAARGGYTTVCMMPNTSPVIDSPEIVSLLLERAKGLPVHIVPVAAVTYGQKGLVRTDAAALKKAGAHAMSEDGKSVMDTALYEEAMVEAKREELLVMAHCEDQSLVRGGVMNAGKKADELGLRGISNAVEDIITARDVILAKETGARLHLCHCSTSGSVQILKLAKEQGVLVTGEVCPHHFTLSDEDIPGNNSLYKMNPPLRGKKDVEALKQALKEGVMDVISTDHAPHSAEEKSLPMEQAPFGIVGLETALPLTVTELLEKGYLTPMQMAERMSYTPAKILKIQRGSLREGSVADVVIFDPKKEFTIDVNTFASKGKNSPFQDKVVRGCVKFTILAGEIVYGI